MKKSMKKINKLIKPRDESKYYVSYRDNGDLYYFDKTTINCWTRNPSKASPMSLTECEKIVKESKKNNLTDTWIIAPFESIFKNALQDISDVLWGDRWHEAFDVMSLKEEIGRLQAQEIKLEKQTNKLGKFKKIFKSVMKTEFPNSFDEL